MVRGPAVVASVVAAALLAPGVPPPPAEARAAPTARRPNILIIATDDQRARGTLVAMPRTRRWFTSDGVAFRHAFVTTPTCAPSRATIMTGRYAHNHGVVSNRRVAAAFDQDTTLQRYLREAGYRTGFVGKFMNGWDVEVPPAHFDRWAIRKGKHHDAAYNVDGVVQTIPGYSTRVLGDLAVDVLGDLASDPSTPWLLYVTPSAPHGPWIPEDAYADAPVPPWHGNAAVRDGGRRGKPSFIPRIGKSTLRDGRRVRRQQLRMLMSVDDLVDRVFNTLERAGALENTLAVFTSDNGMGWADHGIVGKGLPYTPIVRVPLLLRWPDRLQGGEVRHDLAANLDLAPTILEAADVTAGHEMDGRSLLEPTGRSRLLFEWTGRFRWASFRTAGRQYSEYYDRETGRIRFRELYRLRSDPFELVNAFPDARRSGRPDVRRLRQTLRDLQRCAGTTGALACP